MQSCSHPESKRHEILSRLQVEKTHSIEKEKNKIKRVNKYRRMSEITYVSPQLYLLSNDGWNSDLQKPGYLPILRTDLLKFQHTLQNIRNAHGNLRDNHVEDPNSVSNNRAHQDISSTIDSASGDVRESQGDRKYQSLKHFLPIALEQQLHTISLQSVPSRLSNGNFETFLYRCIHLALLRMGYSDEQRDLVECWTNVQYPGLETQDIFVRFTQSNSSLYGKVVKYLELLFSCSSQQQADEDKHHIRIHMDANTRQFIEDMNLKIADLNPEHICEVSKLLEDLKNIGASEKKDEVFGVESQSMDYEIDLNTLSDLPKYTLEQLCKDIIEFRTRVVSIEKEKRVRESYEESKHRRHQMMRIFDQIKKSRNEEPDLEDEDLEGSDKDDEEEDDGDEDDLVLENRKLEKEKRESMIRYENMLKQLNTQIEPRLQSLQQNIDRERNYEEILKTQWPLYLKELMHNASDPYYDHHRTFKEQEEKKDEIDRKEKGDEGSSDMLSANPEAQQEELQKPTQENEFAEVAKEKPSTEQVKIKFALKKAIDKSVDHYIEEDLDVEEQPKRFDEIEAPLADVLPFTEEQLENRLKDLKEARLVDELVKEYLGVYEDELVDYIYENIREHKDKQILLQDLKETFDEDAITIVGKIWSSQQFK